MNGKLLGKHEGMFLLCEFEVTDMLQIESENLLAVVIEPAPTEQPHYFCIMPQECKEVIILSDSGSIIGKSLYMESFMYQENIILD